MRTLLITMAIVLAFCSTPIRSQVDQGPVYQGHVIEVEENAAYSNRYYILEIRGTNGKQWFVLTKSGSPQFEVLPNR